MYTIPSTTVNLNIFAENLGVGNHHMDVVVAVVGALSGVGITLGLRLGLCTTLFDILPGCESF